MNDCPKAKSAEGRRAASDTVPVDLARAPEINEGRGEHRHRCQRVGQGH